MKRNERGIAEWKTNQKTERLIYFQTLKIIIITSENSDGNDVENTPENQELNNSVLKARRDSRVLVLQ